MITMPLPYSASPNCSSPTSRHPLPPPPPHRRRSYHQRSPTRRGSTTRWVQGTCSEPRVVLRGGVLLRWRRPQTAAVTTAVGCPPRVQPVLLHDLLWDSWVFFSKRGVSNCCHRHMAIFLGCNSRSWDWTTCRWLLTSSSVRPSTFISPNLFKSCSCINNNKKTSSKF